MDELEDEVASERLAYSRSEQSRRDIMRELEEANERLHETRRKGSSSPPYRHY